MMSDNTLYYFYSTIAQVLAAMSALLAVFTQFKFSELKEFMVGDGKATWQRMKNKEKGYVLADEQQHKTQADRMRDAIGRQSLKDIEGVLQLLAQGRIASGETIDSEPRGPIFLLQEFEIKLQQIKQLKRYTYISSIVSSVTLLLSIIAIAFVDYLKDHLEMQFIVSAALFIVTIIAFVYALLGIQAGMKDIDGISTKQR